MADTAPAKPKKHKRASSRRAHAIVPAKPPEGPIEPPVPAKMGRPTIYTPELAESICERIANGETLASIVDDDGSPKNTTIHRWLEEKPDFRAAYERARVIQAELEFDRLKEMADDGRNDWMEARDSKGEIMGWRVNGEAVQRSRLRVETAKWRVSMMNPARFATVQRQEVSGPGGGPIEIMASTARDRITAIIMAGQKILPKLDDQDSVSPDDSDDAAA